MIKEMNGWKIVSHTLLRNYLSLFQSTYSIEYPVNKRVYPTLKDSMLFFFPQKEDAEAFILAHQEKIIPCIAYDCMQIKYVAAQNINNEMFWKLRKNKKSTKRLRSSSIEGAWVAKSIMCLE